LQPNPNQASIGVERINEGGVWRILILSNEIQQLDLFSKG